MPSESFTSPGQHAGPVLIIEDDRNIAALVEKYLQTAGYATLVVHDGAAGLDSACTRNPVLVVLDLMLPSMDGWEICREIRKRSDVPIVILTAREEETDRIVGFSLGADDYVIKPFSPRELVERVKAILRRATPATQPAERILEYRGLSLEPQKRKVLKDGAQVSLTPSEYTVLHALFRSPGRVFTRDELLSHLYTRGEAVIDRVIDVHVGKLRQKIEDDPSNPRYIHTVHGVGYRFAEDDGA